MMVILFIKDISIKVISSAVGLKGNTSTVPHCILGGKLPNYYPSTEISNISRSLFTSSSGNSETLNKNESGFYRMYFKFLSNNIDPTDDPSLLTNDKDGAMFPCDILGNTLRSSYYTHRLAKLIDEVDVALDSHFSKTDTTEKNYLILQNSIVNLINATLVDEADDYREFPRMSLLRDSFADNFKTATSYQLLYLRIIICFQMMIINRYLIL